MDYTDIEIIECNKKQSIAGTDLDSNNAIYTNKIGSSITLNEGDKVNVEYCFINEKGCGADTIEIEGKELGVDPKRFYYTADEQEGIDRSIDILDDSGNIKYPAFKTLERRQVIHNELKYVDKMLRDDEVNIQQYYYRSTNCEHYCFLPRRFISSDANLESQTPHTTIWNQEHSQPFNYTITGGAGVDPATNGACGVVMSNPNCIFSGDYKQMAWKTNSNQSFYAYIPKTTAEKYTILARDMTIVDIEYDNNKYLNFFQGRTRNSPAMRKYDIFTTLNTLKVDKGFNSPENIASKITEQLQSNQKPVKHYVGDPGSNPNIKRVITETTDTLTYKAINCACINTFGKTQYEAFLDDSDTTPTDKVKDAVLYEQSFQFIGCKRPELTIAGRKCAEQIETYISPGVETDIRYLQQYATIQNTDTIAVGSGDLTDPIITSWEYTNHNLELLRDLFIAQGKYPELFTDMPQDFKTYEDSNGDIQERDLNNLAFLHTNQRTNTKQETIGGQPYYQIVLGDDGYNADNIDKENPVDLYSLPFFFYCDRSKLNQYDTGQSIDFLCYGFATYSDKLADGKRYIVIHPELSGGVRAWIDGADPWVSGTQIIGWDSHFSAYSSQFIMLWNGYLNYDYGGILDGVNGISSSNNTNGGTRVYNTSGHTTEFRKYDAFLSTSAMLSKMYVGASNSALSFLTNGHFSWSYLHEPERQGQPYNAGSNTGTNPILDTAKDEVYKINKKLQKWTWSPDYTPYAPEPSVWEYGPKAQFEGTGMLEYTDQPQSEWAHPPNKEEQSFLNPRLTEFTLTDSMGGVFFNLGDAYTQEVWGDSLLGILGFTYEQYNPTEVNTTNNHLSRITYKNIYNVDKWITTNSDVVATEVINYVMNRYNATQYTSQIPTSKWLPVNAGFGGGGTWSYTIPANTKQFTPNIVENTTSIEAPAQELPKKMLQSYYTIRSDIITENKYYGGNDIYGRGRGGGIKLPVIAVCNKENGDGDFYFSSGENLQFTITKPITINHITTSIHEPDGNVAQVGDNCCVIYKIQKDRKLDPDIVGEILNNITKKSK